MLAMTLFQSTRFFWISVGILYLGLLTGEVARCQQALAPSDSAVQDTTVKRSSGPDEIQEVGSPLYYVPDAITGRIVPVHGITLQQLDQAFDVLDHLGPRPPKFNVGALSISGQAEKGRNELELDVEIQIVLNVDGWVRVPLGLAKLVMNKPEEHEGEGKLFIVPDDTYGHVAWFKSTEGSKHTIKFRGLTPLSLNGDSTRVELDVPRSSVSQFNLFVPRPGIVGGLNNGSGILERDSVKDGTQLTATGLERKLVLTWKPQRDQPLKLPPVIESEANIIVQVLDEDRIQQDAELNIQIHGGQIDRLRIRLPAGSRFLESVYTSADYTVRLLSDDDSLDETNLADVVEIQFAKPTTGSQQISLAVEQSLNDELGTRRDKLDIAGFEVIGARQQSGHLALSKREDEFVDWKEGVGIRRVAEMPESLRQKATTLLAAFAFSQQPYSLQLDVRAQKALVHVDPVYLVKVGENSLELEATLTYNVRDARVDVLEIDLGEWIYDSIESGGMVNSEGVNPDRPNKPLLVPLREGKRGKFVIKLLATPALERSINRIEFGIPRPLVATQGATTLIVLPDDNVELTPLEHVGFTRDLSPPGLLPERVQKPFVYRTQPDAPVNQEPRFACDLIVHPQEVEVALSGNILVDGDKLRISQKCDFQIDYERMERFVFNVPDSFFDEQFSPQDFSPNLLLDGQPLEGAAWELEDESSGMSVELPDGGRIGACQLVIEYSRPLPVLSDSNYSHVTVPLLMPAAGDVQLSTNRLLIRNTDEVDVKPLESNWMPDAESPAPISGLAGIALVATGKADEIDLDIQLVRRSQQKTIAIDKAWLQSWFTSTVRQDRAVYYLTTNRNELNITLPAEVAGDSIRVLLDKKLVAISPPDGNSVRIPLDTSVFARTYLLEMSYRFNNPSLSGVTSLAAPQIAGASWIQQIYWQLIVPPNKHVVIGPTEMTSEQSLSAWSPLLREQSRLSQDWLERWIGATSQISASPQNNQYLYSSFGPVRSISIRTASRRNILLSVSGAALAIGLLMLYVPLMRSGAVLLIGFIVLFSVTLAWPTTAILTLQASLVGIGLTILAHVMVWLNQRRHQKRAVIQGRSGIDLDRHSSEIRPARRQGSSIESTATRASPAGSDLPQ